MNTILAENLVSFKELEQKIFAFVCELGREITQIMLESYDKELAEGRDKKIYRDKGTRNTSIKTVMVKFLTQEESIEQRMKKDRWNIFIFWIKPCRWIKLA